MNVLTANALTISPIAETLALLAARSPLMAVATAAEGEGWITARDFFSAPDLVGDCVQRVARTYNTADLKIAGSFFLLRYTWKVGVGIIGTYLAAGRVPCLTLDTLAFRFGADGYPDAVAFLNPPCALLPGDPRAADPDVRVVKDADALRGVLRTTLESYCAALITALRPHTPLNARALWGLATDRHAQIALRVCEALGDASRAVHEVAALTHGTPSLFSERTAVVSLSDGAHEAWTVQASGCCLAYKLPGTRYCATCPLLTPSQRLGLLLERKQG